MDSVKAIQLHMQLITQLIILNLVLTLNTRYS